MFLDCAFLSITITIGMVITGVKLVNIFMFVFWLLAFVGLGIIYSHYSSLMYYPQNISSH